MTIRVVAVEDDHRYRASLATLFGHADGFELAASFATGEDLLAALPGAGGPPERGWDLALVDLDLPGATGIDCIRALAVRMTGIKVVVLTVLEDADTVLEAICAGADGYLTKRAPPADMLAELRSVMAGGAPLSAGVARTVLTLLRTPAGRPRPAESPPADGAAPGTRLSLTQREQDVLGLLVQGLTYQRVADQLGISLDTVRSHVRRVYSKLQVHSVAEAVSRAIREGLV